MIGLLIFPFRCLKILTACCPWIQVKKPLMAARAKIEEDEDTAAAEKAAQKEMKRVAGEEAKLKEELYKKVGSAASIRWGGLRKLVRGGK